MPTLSDVIKGIAVADAAGNPLEFRKDISLGAVAASLRQSELRVSDDTQMTLFCAEALFRAGSRVDTMEEQLKAAYLRWYKTQIRGAANCIDDGLLGFSSLYSVGGPRHYLHGCLPGTGIGEGRVQRLQGQRHGYALCPNSILGHQVLGFLLRQPC